MRLLKIGSLLDSSANLLSLVLIRDERYEVVIAMWSSECTFYGATFSDGVDSSVDDFKNN